MESRNMNKVDPCPRSWPDPGGDHAAARRRIQGSRRSWRCGRGPGRWMYAPERVAAHPARGPDLRRRMHMPGLARLDVLATQRPVQGELARRAEDSGD